MDSFNEHCIAVVIVKQKEETGALLNVRYQSRKFNSTLGSDQFQPDMDASIDLVGGPFSVIESDPGESLRS